MNDRPWLETKVIFLCDPKKNTRCKKTSCYLNGGDCRGTLHPAFSLLDTDGKPMILKKEK